MPVINRYEIGTYCLKVFANTDFFCNGRRENALFEMIRYSVCFLLVEGKYMDGVCVFTQFNAGAVWGNQTVESILCRFYIALTFNRVHPGSIKSVEDGNVSIANATKATVLVFARLTFVFTFRLSRVLIGDFLGCCRTELNWRYWAIGEICI